MMILLIMMSMAVITDIRYYKIPNILTLIGLVVGMIIRYYQEGLLGVLIACLSIVVIFIFLFPFYLIHGIGAGDIKLFCMMAAYLNPQKILVCFILTFMIASVIAITKMIYQGMFLYKLRKIFCYLEALFLTQSYREYEKRIYMKAPENIIRMSIPACLSVISLLLINKKGVWL